MINIKQYCIPNLILKIKFKDHKKNKNKLLKLIKLSNDKNWTNKDVIAFKHQIIQDIGIYYEDSIISLNIVNICMD